MRYSNKCRVSVHKTRQENDNTPRYRTPLAIPRSPIMKGIPLWPVGRGLGVCSKGVLK